MNRDELREKLWGSLDEKSKDAFKKYHADHPDIYRNFKKYSFMMLGRGRKRYSAKCIIERIRWDYDMEYSDKEFKISNSMTSFYVRFLIWNHEEFAGFFQLKKVKGIRHKEKNQLPSQEIVL